MNIIMKEYTVDRINDVIEFELNIRKEEDFWGWEINQGLFGLDLCN